MVETNPRGDGYKSWRPRAALRLAPRLAQQALRAASPRAPPPDRCIFWRLNDQRNNGKNPDPDQHAYYKFNFSARPIET